MNQKPTVTFTIGLPTAGKTTWAKSLKEEKVIISSDDTILAYFQTSNYNEASKAYQTTSTEEREQISNIQKIMFLMALKNGKDIIIDKTHLLSSQIEKFYNLIPANYRKTCVVFPITFDEVLKRNAQRENKTISEAVLIQMFDKYKENAYEGFKWDSVTIMPVQGLKDVKKNRDSIIRLREDKETKTNFELLCKSKNIKVSSRIRELIRKDLRGEI